jgi:PAS domain S-box-containing protein
MQSDINMLNRKTEKLKAEALRSRQSENEAVYRSLFEDNHAVMLLIDPVTAAIWDANAAACSYYGWSREQLKKLRIDEINTLSRDEVFTQMQLAQKEKRRNFLFKHRRADGSVRDVEVYSGPLTVRGQTLLYSIVHDITDRVQTQLRLTESERRLSTLTENLPGMAYRCLNDKSWTMKFVSEGCFALTGYPPEHLLENRRANYAELIHPDDRQAVWEQVQAGIDKRRRFNMTYRIRCADGAEKWVMEIGQGVFSESGNLLALEGFITDITERKRSEEALRHSEERHRQIVEASTDAILVRSGDLVVYANPAAIKLFRAKHATDLVGKRYLDLVHPDDREESAERIRRGRNQNWLAPPREHRIVTVDGQVVHVESTGVPVQYEGEAQLFGIFRDITKRKKAEEALRQSEEKFRLSFQTSPDAINLNRLSDGMCIDINDGFTKLTGYTRKDAIGKTSLELNIWMDQADRERLIDGLRNREYVENLEARFRRKNGEVGTGLMSARILRLNQEELILSITRDITERKQVENALRESENRYHQILEASTDAVLVRLDEKIVYVNPSAVNLLGAGCAQVLIGKPYLDLVHPEDRGESAERVKKSMNGDWIAPPREHRLMTLDGRIVNVESTGVPIRYQGKIHHFGMFRDITERKKVVEQLRETEKRYRELAESLPQVIFEVDSKSNITYLNQTGYTLFGYTPEDLANGFNVLEAFIYEDRERIVNDIRLNLQGQRLGRQEYTAVKKNGTKFPVGVHANRVMREQIATGIRGILIDLTPIKRAEEEKKKLELQLHQAQKMEAIGALAGGIAHDFNNILSAIIGYTQLAMLNEGAENCTSELNEVLKASNRAKDLVKQILAFSRQTEEERMPVRVARVAKEAVKFLRATIPATIEINTRIDETSGAVLANSVELHQIIMNLCTNAQHAIGEQSGLLEVAVQNTKTDFSQKNDLIDLRVGSYVQISVKDTGHGMAPEVIKKIFDPYFTTKEKGVGTGLGLAVVHGIVKKYEGTIIVESEPEKGTTFHIYLPIIDIAAPITDEQPKALTGGYERILLVDDEKMLVEVGQQALNRLGYEVVSRTSPIEALELFKAKPDYFDLVITDKTMPGMNGDVLAKELLAIRPGLPVILCTGYSQAIDAERAEQLGIRAFVMKPILINEISAAVRQALSKE